MTAVDSLLSYARTRQAEMVAQLRQFVECESPSDDPAAVNRFVELVSDAVTPYGRVKTFGRHLVCEVELPGRKKSGQVMALGHLDTVWPVGTLRTMPFRQGDGRLWGPGVLDMKAGIAFFIFAARALRMRGYNVMEASGGEEALEIVRKAAAPIHLLITDVVMPNMDGPTLVRHVRRLRPDMAVIFMSGYAEEAFRRNDEKAEDLHFLPKPFGLKQLAAKVKEVLSGAPAPKRAGVGE